MPKKKVIRIDNGKKGDILSLEENKALVRKFIEAYNKNKQNLDDIFEEFVAPDYFDHTHQCGPEGVKQLFKIAFKAFPDWHETLEDIIAEGDTVWHRFKVMGTHEGEFYGLAPTGKKATSEIVDLYRIVNGKHVEGRFITDTLDFLKQIGAIEYTEQGKKLFPEEVT